MHEDEEYEPRDEWQPPRFSQRRPRRLQELTIRNSGRTGGLARSASQAPVNMRVNGRVVRRNCPLEQRSHEENTAPRALVLVLEREIRRTRLQAEATVNARVDPRKRGRKRRVRERARGYRVRGSRIFFSDGQGAAQCTGPMMPGLRILCGSNDLLIPCDRRSAITLGESVGHMCDGRRSNTIVAPAAAEVSG